MYLKVFFLLLKPWLRRSLNSLGTVDEEKSGDQSVDNESSHDIQIFGLFRNIQRRGSKLWSFFLFPNNDAWSVLGILRCLRQWLGNLDFSREGIRVLAHLHPFARSKKRIKHSERFLTPIICVYDICKWIQRHHLFFHQGAHIFLPLPLHRTWLWAT